MAAPRFSWGKLSTRMAWDVGCRAPPPRPCMMRKKISQGRLGARPQSMLETVKIPTQVM